MFCRNPRRKWPNRRRKCQKKKALCPGCRKQRLDAGWRKCSKKRRKCWKGRRECKVEKRVFWRLEFKKWFKPSVREACFHFAFSCLMLSFSNLHLACCKRTCSCINTCTCICTRTCICSCTYSCNCTCRCTCTCACTRICTCTYIPFQWGQWSRSTQSKTKNFQGASSMKPHLLTEEDAQNREAPRRKSEPWRPRCTQILVKCGSRRSCVKFVFAKTAQVHGSWVAASRAQ